VKTESPQPTACDLLLPKDLGACHAMIGELLEQLQGANRRMRRMEHQLEGLLRRLYGRSAERLDPNQMVLFADLLKQLQPQTPPAPETPAAPPAPSTSRGHGRRRIPEDLPRRRIVHDLAEEEKPCPCCGKMREMIGDEKSEQLDYEPAKLSVIEHVRLKYACRACEQAAAEGGPQIATAEKPLAPIEKGLAAPGLLSYVIVSKYSDHLPLYRLERILGRHKIDIARSTMCDWMRDSAAALKPLYDLMVREVLASKVIHTDDTPVDVLDRNLPETRIGRFWVYVGDGDHPHDVFTYTATRSRDGPMTFLKGWGKDARRYLQADAFGGYDCLYARQFGGAGGRVTEVACWAHARRKFYEARTSDSGVATQALAYIRLLYDIEDEAKEQFRRQGDGDGARLAGAEPSEARPLAAIRLELRQAKALPLLGQFKAWLESRQATCGGPVLPKSPMGQAIAYVLNQWEALAVYVTDGDLAIDNNAAENALRRIAIGRKNWLFCGSDNGGHTAAVLFSLIASCARHEVDPFAYLRDVLTRIAAHPMNRLGELLPDRWKPAAPSHA
jgi:transposase